MVEAVVKKVLLEKGHSCVMGLDWEEIGAIEGLEKQWHSELDPDIYNGFWRANNSIFLGSISLRGGVDELYA